MSRNLMARIAVAAVAIPIILWMCYEGGWWLWGMLALFVSVAAAELLAAEGFRMTRPAFWVGAFAIAVLYCTMTLPGPPPVDTFGSIFRLVTCSAFSMAWFAVIVLVSGMIYAIGKSTPSQLFSGYTRFLWGTAYLGFLYGAVYHLGVVTLSDSAVSGGDRLLFLFGILWVGDTAAMWTGKTFGKRKLAPAVSPNKTVAGFVGGILGALAVGVLMIFWKYDTLPWYHVLIIAAGCSIFGQLGDLVESLWKRSLGIKDSSAIIPGHGGVLDRFDSLLFAAPFMLAYTIFVLQ